MNLAKEENSFCFENGILLFEEELVCNTCIETVFESSLNLLVGHRKTSHQKVQWRTDLHRGVEERAP